MNTFGKLIGLSLVSSALLVGTVAHAEESAGPDHDMMVGRFAVGYMGLAGVPVGADREGDWVLHSAPVIGVRYWLDSFMGIDAGIGLGYDSASGEMKHDGVSVKGDGPGYLTFALHVGVPLSFVSGKHYSFQVTPYANLGIASGDNGAEKNKVDHGGFLFEIGARAGMEVHFGFIGMPELSLQAGVGLRFAHHSISSKADGNEGKNSWTTLSTTVNGDPWDIFAGNISALYYF